MIALQLRIVALQLRIVALQLRIVALQLRIVTLFSPLTQGEGENRIAFPA